MPRKSFGATDFRPSLCHKLTSYFEDDSPYKRFRIMRDVISKRLPAYTQEPARIWWGGWHSFIHSGTVLAIAYAFPSSNFNMSISSNLADFLQAILDPLSLLLVLQLLSSSV